ncbi:histidinol-phosphate transaminase [Arthrobacter sp. CAN_C5]|uniref:histidinol-phosphate transaminase n=1 Tax=Arthrobacter sp. CAN_C5 TaxID=2760706 RepID=UPI001AE4AE67|nr:histidinol-phosphate transaminase [Arthrobacter sp. CAN_C5]MBP2215028.1 histidinol-phosphate aminotransferase [Arthrobacter sp. CAN_C5]
MTSTCSLPDAPRLRSVVADLPPYVAGRSAQTALTAALASNESHFAPLPSVIEVIAAEAGRIHRYPNMASVDLREAIAAHLEVSSDEVAVGPGSSGVLQQILSAVCDQDDEVIFAWRSFEAYPILAAVAGAKAARVPLLPDEHHDLDAMAAAVTDRTRVIILCSPNNPTGVSLGAARTEDFLSKVPPHVLVVVDEAYVEFQDEIGEVDALDLYHRYPNICVLKTFSKAYGLAGLRVGYAIARAPLAEGLRRTAIPFGVNRMAQSAAVASLAAHQEMRTRAIDVRVERQRMITALHNAGWDVPDSQANFFWLRCGDDVREQILSALADADILARGYKDDGVRISLADRDTNERVLAVLTERGKFGDQ